MSRYNRKRTRMKLPGGGASYKPPNKIGRMALKPVSKIGKKKR